MSAETLRRGLERGRRLALPAWWSAPVGLGVGLATWPVPGVTPSAGLDNSWKIALHLAATHGLDYGTQVIFTYGPLGFLALPLTVTGGTAVGSILFSLVVWLALGIVVVRAASAAFPPLLALAAAYVALSLPVQIADVPLLLVFFAAVWMLERDPPPGALAAIVAVGVFAGFDVLVKLNSGVTALALLVLAVWRVRGVVAEVALLASAAVTVVALWAVTGNPLGNLPTWVQSAVHVVSGYTETQALDSRSREAQYAWAAALLLVALAALVVHLRNRRVALWLVAIAFAFSFFKEGFVRHDAHDLYFFGAVGIAVLAFAWRTAATRVLGAAALAVAFGAVVATPELRLPDLFHPVRAATRAVDDAAIVFDRGRRDRDVESAKAATRAQLALSSQTLALLHGHTVAVEPFETSAVWAYGLRWHPEPVLQTYGAYDGFLDRANARAIAEAGPQRILRQQFWPGVDGTHPALEAPATFLASLCHYRQAAVDGIWEVLARAADRCGAPRALGGVVEARAGRRVHVPTAAAGELVFARITLRRTLAHRVESLLFKPLHAPEILLGALRYRFVSASADDPLVLRVPPTSGVDPVFGGGLAYDSFTLVNVASPFRVRFYAEPLAGTRRREAPAPVGRISGSALVVGGRRIPVVPGTVDGFADAGVDWGGGGAVTGWAVAGGRPASFVAVFVDARLAAVASPRLPRPDVVAVLHAPRALRSGYRVEFSGRPRRSVRVFGIADGRASELSEAGLPWPHGG